MSYYADRVFETSAGTGTGTILLAGAQLGYVSFFAAFGVGASRPYVIEQPATGAWEIGLGAVVDNGDGTYSLTRSVHKSSNANALVNFGSGTKYVRATLPAEDADSFRTAAAAGANVKTTLPSTIDCVASWSDAAGTLRPSSTVKVLSSASDVLQLGALWGALTTDAYAATITLNLNTSNSHLFTLTSNATLAVSNAQAGKRLLITIGQDATGGRTVTWFSNIYWNNGLAPVLDPTPSGVDEIELECIGFDTYGVPIWVEISRATSAQRKGITTATDAATVTFDLRKSPKQLVTLGGNRTLALQAGSYYVGMPFMLKLKQDGTGSRTVTWFATINWAGGSAPTLTTTANKADWFGFVCTDASGSPKFDGCVIGQGYAP